jgi:hypothetical protein
VVLSFSEKIKRFLFSEQMLYFVVVDELIITA